MHTRLRTDADQPLQGIGHALWNFRGSFGVMDSNRPDVDYQGFHGHQLDRKLLGLLREL